MKIPKATARLAVVVEECGQPELVTMWTKAGADKRLQAAVRKNRILTIQQQTVGVKKDFGVVGFHQGKNVSFWIFRKSLRRFVGKRIVGIDYGLLGSPEVKNAAPSSGRKPLRRTQCHSPSHPVVRPALPKFEVTVRCTAILDVTQLVEAATGAEAKHLALAAMARVKVDFSKGIQARSAVRAVKAPDGETHLHTRFRRPGRLPGPSGEV